MEEKANLACGGRRKLQHRVDGEGFGRGARVCSDRDCEAEGAGERDFGEKQGYFRDFKNLRQKRKVETWLVASDLNLECVLL